MKKTPDEEMEDQIKEHLEEHEHHDEVEHHDPSYHHKTSRWKKPYIILGSLFVIFLMFGWTFSYVDVSGLLRSEIVNSGVLDSEVKIVFTADTLDLVQQEYLDNQEREIKACLFGKYSNGRYDIKRVEFPDISTASVVHISTPPCPADALVDLHSHPWHKCTASQQDLSVFGRLKERNPDMLMMVMCSLDRFSIYSK